MIAAVVGAAVGAFGAFLAQDQLGEQSREEKARGAARVIQLDLRDGISHLEFLEEHMPPNRLAVARAKEEYRSILNAARVKPIEMSRNERTLLATELSTQEWQKLAEAERKIENHTALIESDRVHVRLIRDRQSMARARREILTTFAWTKEGLGLAYDTLKRLAH